MGWSDVGSWAALWAVSGKDAAGNATHGDVIAVDVADSFLRSDGPAIAAVGLRDVVLVATKDAVLAVHRDRDRGGARHRGAPAERSGASSTSRTVSSTVPGARTRRPTRVRASG